MKNFALTSVVVLVAAFATPASAEFVGGSVGFSYSSLDGVSGERKSIEGSVEYAFSDSFSVQADIGYHDLASWTKTIGLHGIYHLNDATALGVFVTKEKYSFGGTTYYGLEAAHRMNDWNFGGYYSKADRPHGDFAVSGAHVRYDFQNGFGVKASIDHLTLTRSPISFIGVTLDRDIGENFNVFARVGKVKTRTSSKTYYLLGGEMTFGNKGGATFAPRGLSRLMPFSL